MSDGIDLETTLRTARLAKLELSPDEAKQVSGHLGRILEYVSSLSELPTDGVQPMAHASDSGNVFRPDILAESLPREQALQNAPKSDGEYFRVPPVLG